jgi:hypothetical protein
LGTRQRNFIRQVPAFEKSEAWPFRKSPYRPMVGASLKTAVAAPSIGSVPEVQFATSHILNVLQVFLEATDHIKV